MNSLLWRELGKSCNLQFERRNLIVSLNKTAEKLVTHFKIAKSSNGRDVGQ